MASPRFQPKNFHRLYIIAGIFFIVIVLYIVVLAVKATSKSHYAHRKTSVEHFTNDAPPVTSDDYKARLNVMTVFDGHMKRKPTPEEINKYMVYENEQDILAALLKDSVQPQSQTTPQTPSTSSTTKNIDIVKQLPITNLSKPSSPADMIVHSEAITTYEETEYFAQQEQENSTKEITISKEYAVELKKQVQRLEQELASFRKVLG